MILAQSAMSARDSIPAGYRDAASASTPGLLSGRIDGRFGGMDNMNRAQGRTVIFRLPDHIG